MNLCKIFVIALAVALFASGGAFAAPPPEKPAAPLDYYVFPDLARCMLAAPEGMLFQARISLGYNATDSRLAEELRSQADKHFSILLAAISRKNARDFQKDKLPDLQSELLKALNKTLKKGVVKDIRLDDLRVFSL